MIVLAILAIAASIGTLALVRSAFAGAGFNPNFISTATVLPTGTPSLIQGPPSVNLQRHYIQLQNDPGSSGIIYVCLCAQVLNYTCSATTAAVALAVGTPWTPPPVSFYLGMSSQQSGNSGIYNACDIQAIPANGTTDTLRILIE